jgi:phage terminase large subunit GpA-like protein
MDISEEGGRMKMPYFIDCPHCGTKSYFCNNSIDLLSGYKGHYCPECAKIVIKLEE